MNKQTRNNNNPAINSASLAVSAFLASFMLYGCASSSNCLPSSCAGPERLVPVEQELSPVRYLYNNTDFLINYRAITDPELRRMERNEFIAARMYAMDLEYTNYEDSLTKEGQDTGFFAAVTNAGLTGAAAAIPLAQTTKLLSAVAAGLTTVHQAYSTQFLLDKTVQILQAQMRSKRAEISTGIQARIKKPVTEYPLGMAMRS